MGRAGINLSFANVGTFRNDVVFVEVVKNEGYKKFFNVAKLLYEFASADLLLHKDTYISAETSRYPFKDIKS